MCLVAGIGIHPAFLQFLQISIFQFEQAEDNLSSGQKLIKEI